MNILIQLRIVLASNLEWFPGYMTMIMFLLQNKRCRVFSR